MSAPELKLFRIDYDDTQHYLEAATMRDAIAIWHQHMKEDNGIDWYGDEEPESCVLIHSLPVLRAVPSIGTANMGRR